MSWTAYQGNLTPGISMGILHRLQQDDIVLSHSVLAFMRNAGRLQQGHD